MWAAPSSNRSRGAWAVRSRRISSPRAPSRSDLTLAPEGAWRDRLWFGLYYLLAFVLLGMLVSFRHPAVIDTFARPYAGNGLAVARIISSLGLFPVYATLSVVLIVFGFIKREWLRAVLISVVTLLVSWQVSDACKAFFHRPRPLYWYVHHETSWSYPSGHAVLAVAFYGFWTAVLWSSPSISPAAKRWIRVAFALFALAIGWSRLALGAHFLTDVIGGYLLGAAMTSFAIMVYRLLEAGDEATT